MSAVFDDRVSINNKLEKGKYYQCYGCRRPITKEDMLSPKYKKECHAHIVFERSDKQKMRSQTRQDQINRAKIKKETTFFNKISK